MAETQRVTENVLEPHRETVGERESEGERESVGDTVCVRDTVLGFIERVIETVRVGERDNEVVTDGVRDRTAVTERVRVTEPVRETERVRDVVPLVVASPSPRHSSKKSRSTNARIVDGEEEPGWF